MLSLQDRSDKNIRDILEICIRHNDKHKALIIYDTDYKLTEILLTSYKRAIPNATLINFNISSKEDILEAFDDMASEDTVILIQSTNFLLNDFRIRLHLFNAGLKVIEHMHLTRNSEEVFDVYIDSLAYDKNWYPIIAPKLKSALDKTDVIKFISGDATLTSAGGLEEAKLNIGDYTGMTNVGGTFPIGEVFTEARDLTRMNGSIYIYAFAGSDFNVSMHEPFLINIEDGLVTSYGDNAPKSFKDILKVVNEYERPMIREIGLGLNRAITRERYLGDITAFERILGLHFSLGEKHSVYKKEGMPTKKTKFHIDIFPVIDSVLVDNVQIFDGKSYTL